MNRLDEQICEVLRKHFCCVCASQSPYCRTVTELMNLFLEKCEECEYQLDGGLESAREEGFFKDA